MRYFSNPQAWTQEGNRARNLCRLQAGGKSGLIADETRQFFNIELGLPDMARAMQRALRDLCGGKRRVDHRFRRLAGLAWRVQHALGCALSRRWKRLRGRAVGDLAILRTVCWNGQLRKILQERRQKHAHV